MVGMFNDGCSIGIFRTDRILKRPDILEDNADPFPETFDFEKFLQTSFRMYGTEHRKVVLICSNEMMDAILDKFGKNVAIYRHDNEHFYAEVDVVVSNVFFAWVFGFGGDVAISGPADVKEEYKRMVMKAAEMMK